MRISCIWDGLSSGSGIEEAIENHLPSIYIADREFTKAVRDISDSYSWMAEWMVRPLGEAYIDLVWMYGEGVWIRATKKQFNKAIEETK